MRVAAGLAGPLFLLALTGGAAAAPILQGASACNYSGADKCLFFTLAATPFTARSLDFNAPAAGKALVTVTGSGVCTNPVGSVSVADFDSQIVNDPAATPYYGYAGGNRFKFTLPAYDPGNVTGNGVFNLASERLFTVKKAGTQHYALRMIGNRIDQYVECDVLSIAMSVLFVPN